MSKIEQFFFGFDDHEPISPRPIPVTAEDRVVSLSVEIPTCCKPDQEEGLAREAARALHYSIGGGIHVYWETPETSVDVTFSSSAHRDHAVSP